MLLADKYDESYVGLLLAFQKTSGFVIFSKCRSLKYLYIKSHLIFFQSESSKKIVVIIKNVLEIYFVHSKLIWNLVYVAKHKTRKAKENNIFVIANTHTNYTKDIQRIHYILLQIFHSVYLLVHYAKSIGI
jgi:hypothetical protein